MCWWRKEKADGFHLDAFDGLFSRGVFSTFRRLLEKRMSHRVCQRLAIRITRALFAMSSGDRAVIYDTRGLGLLK